LLHGLEAALAGGLSGLEFMLPLGDFSQDALAEVAAEGSAPGGGG
jgi:hypothetical protein